MPGGLVIQARPAKPPALVNRTRKIAPQKVKTPPVSIAAPAQDTLFTHSIRRLSDQLSAKLTRSGHRPQWSSKTFITNDLHLFFSFYLE
jgi:hypothetical protein